MIGRVVLATILISFSVGQVRSEGLDSECEPSGLVAKGKEAWSPKKFWTAQIKEIQEYVENEKTAYRLSMIERKRDRVNERLDDEEMKELGIEQYSDPELDRDLAEIDRELLQMDRERLQDAIEWGRKCAAYAKRQLSQLQ